MVEYKSCPKIKVWVLRPLKNVTFFRQARKARILTGGIHKELLILNVEFSIKLGLFHS